MIDIENEVFTKLVTILRTTYSGIFVSGALTSTEPTFPAVFIEEIGNEIFVRTQDSSQVENHALVTYQIRVITKKTSGTKAECKKIFQTIDSEMNTMGFIRRGRDIINMEDAKLYHLVGRYTAVVSRDKIIYRR